MAATIEIETGTIQAEGGPLYYEVAGEGHPLVLVHAGVADHTMWDDQFEAFAQRYRVVRYDTRGYGKSPVKAEGHEFSNRQDIYELLSHLGIEKTYILGLSRGGMIALDFTLEHPEMVDALIWVASGVGGHEHPPTEAEMALFTEYQKVEEGAWEKKDYALLADWDVKVWADGPGQPEGRADSRVRARVREMCINNYSTHTVEGKPVVLDPPAVGRLHEIQVPTLVVVGDLDTSDTQAAADFMAEKVEGARKVVFPGVAHMVNMEKPEEFTNLALNFLGEVEAKSR